MVFRVARSTAPGTTWSPTMKAGVPWMLSVVGERQIVLQLAGDRRRRHVVLEPVDIEPDRCRHLVDRVVGDVAARRHHRRVKGVVLALLLRGERRAGRGHRYRPEDRKLLIDEAQLGVLLQ